MAKTKVTRLMSRSVMAKTGTPSSKSAHTHTSTSAIRQALGCCLSSRLFRCLHVLWAFVYAVCGCVQFVSGIYFMLELPIFQLGSNIWTGAWNVFCAATTIVLCISSNSTLSNSRAQGLLLLGVTVMVAGIVNIVIMEVGEWRAFLSEDDRRFVQERKLQDLMDKAYTSTTLSTAVALLVSFLGTQHSFFYLQLRNMEENETACSGRDKTTSTSASSQTDLMLSKDTVVQRDSEQELNLKTPNGIALPNPSWVFNSSTHATTVLPKSINTKSALEPRPGTLKRRNLIVHHREFANGTRLDNFLTMPRSRHAVIKRHKSMFVHPKATSNIQAQSGLPQYHWHEVSGHSEVRPIVTVQRSRTTVGVPRALRSKSGETANLRVEMCEFQTDDKRLISNLSKNKKKINIAERSEVNLDSCHGELKYQAVERLEEEQSHLNNSSTGKNQYSSMENLTSIENFEELRREFQRRPHYGSTESISSLSSNRVAEEDNNDNNMVTTMTQTPDHFFDNRTSRNASHIHVLKSNQRVLGPRPSRVQKSNSSVSSMGRLRLHVDSFKESNEKSTRKPPTKPLRKSRQTGMNGGERRMDRRRTKKKNNEEENEEIEEENAESPELNENSSTSGYSSPSHSNDQKNENGNKVTVIQIVPPSDNLSTTSNCDLINMAGHEDESLSSSAVEEARIVRHQQARNHRLLPSAPKVATINASSSHGSATANNEVAHKRRLPDLRVLANCRAGVGIDLDALSKNLNTVHTLPRSSRSAGLTGCHRPSPLASSVQRLIPLPPVPELRGESLSPNVSLEPNRKDEEKLRSILALMHEAENRSDDSDQDTVQYLSRLEHVARRLKDQILARNDVN